jgi:hypothetical protein
MIPKRPTHSQARTPEPGAVDFRQAIEHAESEGVSRDQMTLRLTLRDDSRLKRDRTLAVEDLSFADGEMRFLGVKVVAGGIISSGLDLGEG